MLALIRNVCIIVFTSTFIIGICFAADDLNLDNFSLESNNNYLDISVDDYRSVIESYDLNIDDAKLEKLLSDLDSQLSEGDYEAASRTKEDIQKYLEENPDAAPAGLEKLITNSIIYIAGEEEIVKVDLESLSEQVKLEEDFNRESPEQAENIQKLAQLLWDKNPDLARDLMDMSNLINLGRDENARELYREIDRDLLTAILDLDPELVSRAFEYLEGGITEPINNNSSDRITPPNSSNEIFPSINNIGPPFSSTPIPSTSLPSVNLKNASILIMAIMIPLLILPIFLFRSRVQSYFPKPKKSSFIGIDTEDHVNEPTKPKERVLYHFNRLINIMSIRGIKKHESETHREYSSRFEGKKEEIDVKEVSRIYEIAKFTNNQIENEEADKCARIVDTIKEQDNIDFVDKRIES